MSVHQPNTHRPAANPASTDPAQRFEPVPVFRLNDLIAAEQQRRRQLLANLAPYDHALSRDGEPSHIRYWCEPCVGYYGVDHNETNIHQNWPECSHAFRTRGRQCACITCTVTRRQIAGDVAAGLIVLGRPRHEAVAAALGWRHEPTRTQNQWLTPDGNQWVTAPYFAEADLLTWLQAQLSWGRRYEPVGEALQLNITYNTTTGATLRTQGWHPIRIEAPTLRDVLEEAVMAICVRYAG